MKQFFDSLIAIGLLLLFAPLLALLSALIWLEAPGTVLERKPVPTKNGNTFMRYTFRTRRNGQVTRLGDWLRRLSFDVLPQLLNVARGEMALVGPQPKE